MNKQLKLNKDGTVKSRGIEWCDYTFNPIAGCFHACQWKMPDGSIANCYAEDVANGIAENAYPLGFEYHYWKPLLLDEPLKIKTPSKIFVGSMADVFGHWVPEEQILKVLDVAKVAPHHAFQFLTKNPKRAAEFASVIPKNCWIGASTPPDFMWNKPLKPSQRKRMLNTTLDTLTYLRSSGITTWLSAEPITIEISEPLAEKYTQWGQRAIDWIVIGAASNGRTLYAPDAYFVTWAVKICDNLNIPVFFKGNMESLEWAKNNWREEFPVNG